MFAPTVRRSLVTSRARHLGWLGGLGVPNNRFASTARNRSIAIVLGAVALSFGASVFALVSNDRPPALAVAEPARLASASESKPVAVAATGSEAPRGRVEPAKCKERPLEQTWPNRPGDCVTRAELRANAMHKIDVDAVLPPATAPVKAPEQVASAPATDVSKQNQSAPATVGAPPGEAASAAAAIVAPEPAKMQAAAIPLPRPAPRAKIDREAVTPGERERLAAAPLAGGRQAETTIRRADAARGKKQAHQHVAGSYRKRGPLKVIGMLFGGWRR
jgi:hypothetical protein